MWVAFTFCGHFVCFLSRVIPGLVAVADGRTAKEKRFSDAAREQQTAAGGAGTEEGRRHLGTLRSLAAADAEHPRLQLRGAANQLHLFPLLSQLITSFQRPASALRSLPSL